jgi:hypothetical protein
MPFHISDSTQEIRASHQIVSVASGGQAVVVPIAHGDKSPESVYTFNESGTQLWGMIADGKNIAELADYLRSEYQLSSEQATADALQFVAALAKEGLIEPA